MGQDLIEIFFQASMEIERNEIIPSNAQKIFMTKHFYDTSSEFHAA